jgi:hypothetical protein
MIVFIWHTWDILSDNPKLYPNWPGVLYSQFMHESINPTWANEILTTPFSRLKACFLSVSWWDELRKVSLCQLKAMGFSLKTSWAFIPILLMVFLNQKFCQFNHKLQVNSEFALPTIEDTEVPYYSMKAVKEYLLVVIFPFFFINRMLVILIQMLPSTHIVPLYSTTARNLLLTSLPSHNFAA